MNEAATVLSIGDGIIDAVELVPGRIEDHPGGAALNLAVGLARLGLKSQLATRFGADRYGFLIERYLREERVQIFNPPNTDFTGVAYSRRVDGEPSYEFSASMFRRRIAFTDQVVSAIAGAAAVAVNSFPFDDARQTDDLLAALAKGKGLIVIDPNPRPRLIGDMAAYRGGAEKVMRMARLVKLSDEDIGHFYGGDQKATISRVLGLGVETLLVTHGAGGASLHTRSGMTVSVPIAVAAGPVVDTMGAGDATLAAVIAIIVGKGLPDSADDWGICLSEAMKIAAATCTSPGGGLVLPANSMLRASRNLR